MLNTPTTRKKVLGCQATAGRMSCIYAICDYWQFADRKNKNERTKEAKFSSQDCERASAWRPSVCLSFALLPFLPCLSGGPNIGTDNERCFVHNKFIASSALNDVTVTNRFFHNISLSLSLSPSLLIRSFLNILLLVILYYYYSISIYHPPPHRPEWNPFHFW